MTKVQKQTTSKFSKLFKLYTHRTCSTCLSLSSGILICFWLRSFAIITRLRRLLTSLKKRSLFFISFPEKVPNPQSQQCWVRLCVASRYIELPTAIKLDLLKIGAVKPEASKVQISLSHYSFSCGQANIARSLPPSLKSKGQNHSPLSQIHF